MAFGYGFGPGRRSGSVSLLPRQKYWSPATPQALSRMSDEEIGAIATLGDWTKPRPHAPGTPGGGLDLVFDAIGVPKGAYGQDYGPTQDESTLSDASALSFWNASQRKLKMKSTLQANDGEGNHVLEGFRIDDGAIDFVSGQYGTKVPVILRQFAVRSPAYDLLVGISHRKSTPLYLEDGLVSGHSNRNVTLVEGAIRRMSLDISGFEPLGLDECEGALIEGSFFRRPADPVVYGGSVPIPGPHADLVQANQGIRMTSFIGNTFYMPVRDGPYAETSAEMNACIYLSPLNTTSGSTPPVTEDVYILGNLVIGGNQSISMRPRKSGAAVRNVLLAFNRYSAKEEFVGGGHIRFSAAEPGGEWANIAVFDDYAHDGTLPVMGGDGLPDTVLPGEPLPSFGVFSFDKQKASGKWREAMWRTGAALGIQILDDNGDLNAEFDLGDLKVQS